MNYNDLDYDEDADYCGVKQPPGRLRTWWNAFKWRHFMGPSGPCGPTGSDGKCECAEKVAFLERRVNALAEWNRYIEEKIADLVRRRAN